MFCLLGVFWVHRNRRFISSSLVLAPMERIGTIRSDNFHYSQRWDYLLAYLLEKKSLCFKYFNKTRYLWLSKNIQELLLVVYGQSIDINKLEKKKKKEYGPAGNRTQITHRPQLLLDYMAYRAGVLPLDHRTVRWNILNHELISATKQNPALKPITCTAYTEGNTSDGLRFFIPSSSCTTTTTSNTSFPPSHSLSFHYSLSLRAPATSPTPSLQIRGSSSFNPIRTPHSLSVKAMRLCSAESWEREKEIYSILEKSTANLLAIFLQNHWGNPATYILISILLVSNSSALISFI